MRKLPRGATTTSDTVQYVTLNGGVTVVTRPTKLDGCFGSWDEQDDEVVIRSEMEDGSVKVRQRFSNVRRYISASVVLEVSDYYLFKDWYRNWCKHGVYASFVKEPDGTDVIVRFTQSPRIRWLATNAVEVSASFEDLPEWR